MLRRYKKNIGNLTTFED